MNRYVFAILVVLSIALGHSQVKELKGVVIADGDIENIHVLNTTSKINATTNQFGIFTIQAKAQDTILFSSIQYKRKIVVVTNLDFEKELFTVSLEDRVNELDEVIVGNILTGDLGSDIANINVKRPINFYDLGIPGYSGPIIKRTRSEKLLHQATSGGEIITLINIISGRKKRLEQRALRDRIFKLKEKIELEYKDSFFENFKLPEKYRKDFFYFCAEDDNFLNRCEHSRGFNIIAFLGEKLIVYKETMAINED